MCESNPDIMAQIQRSEKILEEFNQLVAKLQTEAAVAFKNIAKVPIPTIFQADVLEQNNMVQYATGYNAQAGAAIVKGAENLVIAAITEDPAPAVTAAATVINTVIGQIVGSGSISTGVKESSVKIPGPGNRFAVCVVNTDHAKKDRFFTDQDFYSSYYIFAVFSPQEA